MGDKSADEVGEDTTREPDKRRNGGRAADSGGEGVLMVSDAVCCLQRCHEVDKLDVRIGLGRSIESMMLQVKRIVEQSKWVDVPSEVLASLVRFLLPKGFLIFGKRDDKRDDRRVEESDSAEPSPLSVLPEDSVRISLMGTWVETSVDEDDRGLESH